MKYVTMKKITKRDQSSSPKPRSARTMSWPFVCGLLAQVERGVPRCGH
jgi:hypothetical protein